MGLDVERILMPTASPHRGHVVTPLSIPEGDFHIEGLFVEERKQHLYEVIGRVQARQETRLS